MINNKINEYLYYGYTNLNSDLSWVPNVMSTPSPFSSYTIDDASKLFDYVIDKMLSGLPTDGYFIVPISGGWDSRILLGAILERFDSNQVKTVSYGTPGQLDFDIGCRIADKLNLEHYKVDLSEIELKWNELIDSVNRSPWTYFPDAFFNEYIFTNFAQDDIILSGFMGDPLTGGHTSSSKNKGETIQEFLSKERRVKQIWLPQKDYLPKEALPDIPEQINGITYSELLDIGIRQSKCIAPIVTSLNTWTKWGGEVGRDKQTGALLLCPFTDSTWASYWLRAPKDIKVNQRLYLKMMKHKFPKLAKIPSKYSLGLKPGKKMAYLKKKYTSKFKRGVHRLLPTVGVKSVEHLNYIDFDTAFRERKDYLELLDQSINYLHENNITPWLNIHEIKGMHMSYKANHSNALLLIIGLALNLANEEKK